MGESSVMVSLPQMVDLALNCPEVGAVNFNILHSLLHVLIQQVDLLECKVEFKGNDSERVQNLMKTSKPGPTLNLTEYIVTPGKDQRKVITKKTKYKKNKPAAGDKKHSKDEVFVEKELRVIERRKNSQEEPLIDPSPMTSVYSSDGEGSMHTVVVVEPTADGTSAPHVSVALSRAHFTNLQDEMTKIKQEIQELKDLPANLGLIEALRNADVDKSSPVLDMFQILTLSKRIDATETGLGKLASMVEDLAREHVSVGVIAGAGSIRGGRGSMGSASTDISGKPPTIRKQSSSIAELVKDELDKLEKRIEKLEALQHEAQEKASGQPATVEGSVTQGVSEERVNELENKFAEYTEQVATLDTMFNNQVNILQVQFSDLEKEIGEIVERINAGLPGGDGGEQNSGEMYAKMMEIQAEMQAVTTTAAKLEEDKEDRQTNMNAILEQIELLKTIKANREDLEDALADKADTCAVNRKVSHDQFDAACDDLARGIEDALNKLTQQEQLWQQALDDIQREIETKLDKMELTPLRDFVHNKLKMLQDRMKALAALKKETEAAGTKSKYLRNVNCISCDKDVIMRKHLDPTLMPPAPALPPNKSMAPYLAYELDNLRRQQKCLPHSRNMNHFENAMGVKGKGDDDHICNRYCGGSHTVTTPQQRVARLGHFIQQWGPEQNPKSEGQIRGTDGHFYKARDGGDITPGLPPPPQQEEVTDTYFAAVKSRPSMVVQGDILATRSAMRSVSSRASEADARPSTIRGESQATQTTQERHSIASQRRASKEAPQPPAHRTSKDSGKRSSRSSAGRASHQTRRSAEVTQQRTGSHISFKEVAEMVSPPPSPPDEAEAAPAAEDGGSQEGEAPAEAPAEDPAEALAEDPAEAPAEAPAEEGEEAPAVEAEGPTE